MRNVGHLRQIYFNIRIRNTMEGYLKARSFESCMVGSTPCYDNGTTRAIRAREGWWKVIKFTDTHTYTTDFEVTFSTGTPNAVVQATIDAMIS